VRGNKRWRRLVLLDLVPAPGISRTSSRPTTTSARNCRLWSTASTTVGRCAIGSAFSARVRAFKGHAAFNRVPEKREFMAQCALNCRADDPR